MKINSLWAGEFNISLPDNTQEILNKIKKSSTSSNSKAIIQKAIKSKSVDLISKLQLIKENVYRVLGHYKESMVVIKTREELSNYISRAIENQIIAIDTETNNSLDAITCKLMGGCIYTPGQKNAYIPINHRDPITKERLEWQLTEKDIKEEFERLSQNNTKILTHNGKFDYKVLHCTCDWDMPIYWDSYCAARLIDENEPSAGLKQQYIDKINPDQEKYSIDHLFEGIEYADVDPEVFAYYASTDAYMTYELYKWQEARFKNESLAGSLYILKEIEIPLIEVVAKMELAGIELDTEYADRLSIKYHKLMDDCLARVNEELDKYSPQIAQWRLTPEANKKNPKKSKNGEISFEKSLNEKLENPIKISSPTQLAILLYDVLKMPSVSVKAPRGTGVDELTSLYRKTNNNLCSLILEMRGLEKLLNTFIDSLPKTASPKDGRVHCEFLSLGTDTGRFSSKNPNLQQIPRSNIEVKPMFRAPTKKEYYQEVEDILTLNLYEEVQVDNGDWKRAKDLKTGDIILGEEDSKFRIDDIKEKNLSLILGLTLLN